MNKVFAVISIAALLTGACSQPTPNPTLVFESDITCPLPYENLSEPSDEILRTLNYSLDIEVEERVKDEAKVRMTLTIRNITSDEDVELVLGGAPWYSFSIMTLDCELVWVWPEFILLPIGYHKLSPGEEIVRERDWHGLSLEGKRVRADEYLASAYMSLDVAGPQENLQGELLAGTKLVKVTDVFLKHAPEPTATPIPPTPIPFYDRIIDHAECRSLSKWTRTPTDYEIWDVINKEENWLRPDPQGVAVPGNIERFYGSEYTPYRGVVVYVRERWASDNWDLVWDLPNCYDGVPIEMRAFKGSDPRPLEYIDSRTGKIPVEDHSQCSSTAYGRHTPFPPPEGDPDERLRGIEFSAERIASYVPVDVRIIMRNTTPNAVEFGTNDDSPNVYVVSPEDCRFVRTFNDSMSGAVLPQKLQPYEIVEWILEWPRSDRRQFDGPSRFLLYGTYALIKDGTRWQWVSRGISIP